MAVGLPFGNRFSLRIRVPGRPDLPKVPTGGPGISAVSSDYFETIGTRILRGRPFAHADRAGSPPVAIVSEFMARTVWPSADPIGWCVIVGEPPAPCTTIVGVAADTHRARLVEEPKMHLYIPFGQEVGFGGAVLLVRGRNAPGSVTSDAVRRGIDDGGPDDHLRPRRAFAEADRPAAAVVATRNCRRSASPGYSRFLWRRPESTACCHTWSPTAGTNSASASRSALVSITSPVWSCAGAWAWRQSASQPAGRSPPPSRG